MKLMFTILTGAQFGDEGKGKVIDLLAENYDVVVRFQGGDNAGHTVVVGGKKYKLHLVPSGAIFGRRLLIGPGVVLNPRVLWNEIQALESEGIKLDIGIDAKTTIIMPYHIELDGLREKARTEKIGTTNRGIGFAYVDKIAREEVQMGDLTDPALLEAKLKEIGPAKEKAIADMGGDPTVVRYAPYIDEYLEIGKRLKDRVTDVSREINIALIEEKSVLAEGAQGGAAVRVVILDVSQSMAATDGAVEQIERARTMAANYLRYRPGLAANLIVAGARAEAVFDSPSTNFEALREELGRCRVLPQRLDVARALDLSARMLAPASAGDRRRRELVIVSDFQRSNWTKADFSVLPADTQIQLESTAPAKTLPNLAILRVEGQTARSPSGGMQLEIDVGNYSPLSQKVTVEVTLGDANWRISGLCPAGQSTTLTEEIGIRGTGWQSGEARLEGIDDALAADNVYPFVMHVRPKPTYALLTRQPATERPSSSHYLECALVPDGQLKEKASATVLRLDPSAADRAALAPADLILLDHPGKLSEETGRLLAGLMRRGRPIVYVASELIDATNLKNLAELAGSGLQMPIEFAPPPSGQIRRDLFYTSVSARKSGLPRVRR